MRTAGVRHEGIPDSSDVGGRHRAPTKVVRGLAFGRESAGADLKFRRQPSLTPGTKGLGKADFPSAPPAIGRFRPEWDTPGARAI
ncbi:MAG: hypothetical protein NZ769_02080 [Anaerolineae bacterium]|nr:hypothetical protein [Anaerolineae bacterium]MCX8068317.1 hypothetical protein [Anaerolineae bacterium]